MKVLKRMHSGTGGIKTYVMDMCDAIKTYALGYLICLMILKRMHSGTGYV